MIRISRDYKNFIKTAEDDSQLGEEAAFIITNAQVGSFFHVYSENLMDALNYPHDDVEASLRLFYYCKKVGSGNTENFCKKNSVDWKKFSFVRSFSDKVTPTKVRDPRSCKPCDECACIDLLRMMFAKHFLGNTCIYAGGTNFLNYNQSILFQISPDSAVHRYSKMWDSHPAVYFRLTREDSGVQYANFLCLVQPMMNTELAFSEITDSNILVGKAVGKRVMEGSDAAENTLGRFALFCEYDLISSKLSVKHAKHVFGQLIAYIELQMESVITETAQLNRRHFWLEESNTLLIMGAGLQVQHLVIGEGTTDALLINLDGEVQQKPIQSYKQFITDTSSSALSMVLAVDQERYLLAVLPSVCEAQRLKEAFTKCKKEVNYYRFEYGSDFWNFPRPAEFFERAANETCTVCAVPPEEKKFIRLSLCGHILCDDCIIHYLRYAENFPLKCTASECSGTILATDLDVLLSHFGLTAREDTESTFSLLSKHSLVHFLLTNESGYRRCLTNNCSGILDPKDGKSGAPISKKNLKNGIVCCVCKNIRCGLCGLDVHSTVDCQQYFQKIYEAENPGIANWKGIDPENRRFCPNNDCHAIIEKAAGCNHMQCLRCRKHFCWICEDFQSTTSRKIYAHLEDVHRGNGAEGLEAWEDYME